MLPRKEFVIVYTHFSCALIIFTLCGGKGFNDKQRNIVENLDHLFLVLVATQRQEDKFED